MREILFRGKRIDSGEWVYGYYITNPEWDEKTYGKHHWIVKETNGLKYKVDPSTVGQYTGFCDKNGKKIFEGDVFEWGYAGVKEFRYVVVYDAELASFVGERGFGFVSLNGIDIEIIGNIHDNPELLEV